MVREVVRRGTMPPWFAAKEEHSKASRWVNDASMTAKDRVDLKETLLDMPTYDFNWQLFYRYANPPIFPKGSTIRYTAWYDNSEYNPANPNPNATVRWAPQTHDEMHIGYVEYALPNRF